MSVGAHQDQPRIRPESEIKKYLKTLRPMHLEFIEPSKHYVDVIIPEDGLNAAAQEFVATRIEEMLRYMRSTTSQRIEPKGEK